MKKGLSFALLMLLCFQLLAGCITPNVATPETTEEQLATESIGMQYQCNPFPEGFSASLKYYQAYCPEHSINSLRKKFEVAIGEYIIDHGVPAGFLPSAKHFLFLLLVGTFRPGIVCYPDFDSVAVEYTTNLPDDIHGLCPFAMEVQIGSSDDRCPIILYWDNNYMYFSTDNTWVYLWDMSIILNDSNADLSATQEQCQASVETVLSKSSIEGYKSFVNNSLNNIFANSGLTEFPLFTSAWLGKPHKDVPHADDELVLYLKDSTGNVYCFVKNMRDLYISYNGIAVYYLNAYISW